MDDTHDAAPPAWVARFLEALRQGQNVTAATRTAGVVSSTPYHLRAADDAFRAQWDAIAPGDGRRTRRGGPRRPRGSAKIDRFLIELAATSNVAAAAAVAGISSGVVYKKRREDPAFARAWFAALAEGYDNLEMELLGRLRAGDGAGAGAAGAKFDTAAALRCLSAHRDSVAREKGRRALADEVTTIASINAKIDQLRLNGEAGAKAIEEARKAKARRSSLRSIGEAGTSEAVGPTGKSQARACKKPSDAE